MSITLVSILHDLYPLEFWESCDIPLYLYAPEGFQVPSNPNIKIHSEPYDYRKTWCYQQISQVSLPEHRNVTKDTEEYLWNGHAKVEYVAKTAEINPFGTEYFAWIDINMPDVFKNPAYVRDYLREHYKKIDLELLCIPGCISVSREEYDRVNWRFCGSFFIGSARVVEEFMELYFFHFTEFIEKKLTWEVNFWAWLEKETDWKFHWYYSDHCETMLKIPEPVFLLKNEKSFQSVSYDYFPYPNYRPTSASYLFFQDRHWLNTRYVNYFLTETGSYSYPDSDRTIRNKNICSELVDFLPVNFLEMETTPNSLGMTFIKGFSEGIEDIRLYEYEGEIRFIGTTYSYSNQKGKLRTIKGTYDLSGVLSDAQAIIPPTDTYCEKNWIPWIDEHEYFIYKWCPLEFGRVVENKLVIVKSIPTNPFIFSKIRGSTLFVPFKNERIGVVHYSEETVPRKYYHRLVVFENMEIKRYSDSFCFEKTSVEFCIGFTINTKFVFWISRMDRDPMMIELDIDAFHDKWHLIF